MRKIDPAWNERNQKNMKAYNQKFYADNREEIRAKQNTENSKPDNREKAKQRASDYYEKNKKRDRDIRRERGRKYYAENVDTEKARGRRRYQNNPEYFQQQKRRNSKATRHRKLARVVEDVKHGVRDVVIGQGTDQEKMLTRFHKQLTTYKIDHPEQFEEFEESEVIA